jgi:hypothetical protein
MKRTATGDQNRESEPSRNVDGSERGPQAGRAKQTAACQAGLKGNKKNICSWREPESQDVFWRDMHDYAYPVRKTSSCR